MSGKRQNCSCTTQKALEKPGTHWQVDTVQTPTGHIPLIATSLTWSDRFGSWKARWGINRMNYRVPPGLYGVGTPNAHTPVLVTANYKMSFDRLRQELRGMDAWILVLDTKGINVWCAAGKGSFGTEELVNKVFQCNLSQVVQDRVLILPQLGAVGVAAHEVQKQTGFKVVYGPVRARDLPEFIYRGMKATPKMRQVQFGLWERLVLTPMELVNVLKPLLLLLFGLFLLFLLVDRREGLNDLLPNVFIRFIPFLGAVMTGAVLTPTFLPWVPGRAFVLKGGIMGLIWVGIIAWLLNIGFGSLTFYAYLCLLPTISAFLAMNFTGASTYTSLSGVLHEMRYAVPVMKVLVGIGSILWLAGIYLK